MIVQMNTFSCFTVAFLLVIQTNAILDGYSTVVCGALNGWMVGWLSPGGGRISLNWTQNSLRKLYRCKEGPSPCPLNIPFEKGLSWKSNIGSTVKIRMGHFRNARGRHDTVY